jgi:uncharacterized HAD superfamily protein
MNIGIDFDGVIVDTAGLKTKLAKEAFGIELSLENASRANILKLGIDAKAYDKTFRRIIMLNESHEIPLVESAKGTIDRIYEENPDDKVYVITSRSDFEVPYQRNIMKNKQIKYHRIINTSDSPKNDVCLENKIRAYMDDDLHKLEEINNGYTELFLLTRPYNANIQIQNSNIERVKNWIEFYEKIKCLRL